MRIFAVSNNERPFIADCTVEEAKESRDAFVKVQTMIYQRMRETKKIILTSGGNPGTNREQK